MAQSQFISPPTRVTVIAETDLKGDQLLEVGDRVGFVTHDVPAGEPATVLLTVYQQGTKMSDGTPQTYDADVWSTIGTALYYNPVTKLIGTDPTDWPVGCAAATKAATEVQNCVFVDKGCRSDEYVRITLDFDQPETLAALTAVNPGTIVIRDMLASFGADAAVLAGTWTNTGLTSNGGNNAATVSIGDSGGTGAEVLAAAILPASGATLPFAITADLVIVIGVENIDGGQMSFVARVF